MAGSTLTRLRLPYESFTSRLGFALRRAASGVDRQTWKPRWPVCAPGSWTGRRRHGGTAESRSGRLGQTRQGANGTAPTFSTGTQGLLTGDWASRSWMSNLSLVAESTHSFVHPCYQGHRNNFREAHLTLFLWSV